MRRFLTGLLAASLCLAGVPASAGTKEDVASFVQPTQEGRLAALEALLRREGLAYEIQTFAGGPAGKPMQGGNVVVTLGKGKRDILLTAHYDAKVLKDGTLAGAVVDNAASVVAIIQAARQLKPGAMKHRLRIVFFDQEELGLLGAKAYAAGPDGRRVAAVINFDVNGYGDTPFFADPTDPALAKAVRHACLAAGEDCLAFGAYPPSDHLAFRKAGVPETSISYLPAREAHQLWLFTHAGKTSGLEPDFMPRVLGLIHTPGDTMAAVEPATVERASELAVELVKAADKAVK
ncbi:MAG: M28 family peptidase [Caulobacteraceae bacterium]|nr:MAG: M28 family peptidase [Caulobacteraceae bacterium]